MSDETYYSSIAGVNFPPDARNLVFRGRSGVECERFIRSVRLIALAEGRQDDDGWMLHFATARLSERAMQWHASLNRDIQNNWSRLVQALLIQYPAYRSEETPGGIASSAPVAPLSDVSSQAAASTSTMFRPHGPGLKPGLNVGRLRIAPTLPGYWDGFYLSRALRVTTARADALQVQFLQTTEPYRICIIEWDDVDNAKTRLPGHCLRVAPDHESNTGEIGSSSWGRRHNDLDCWRVGAEGIVEAKYTQEGRDVNSGKLVVGVHDQKLTFIQDFGSWTQKLERELQGFHYEARLVFEPFAL